MNRMRHDDFIKLFIKSGFKIKAVEEKKDISLQKFLDLQKSKLAKNYRLKKDKILLITGAWIIAHK